MKNIEEMKDVKRVNVMVYPETGNAYTVEVAVDSVDDIEDQVNEFVDENLKMVQSWRIL